MVKKRRATISEVAKVANVSIATVSRYINGKYEKMSEETRLRIAEAITEVNYHINRQAQALKRQSTYLIGMVVADVENIFSSILFKGADEILRSSGYQIILMNSDNSLELESQQLRRLIDLQIDGLIFQPMSRKASQYKFLQNTEIPTVLVDRKIQPQIWTEVLTDNYYYSKMLGGLLIRMGYKQILIFSEKISENSAREERYNAIKDLINGSSSNLVVQNIITDEDTTNNEIYEALLEKTNDFTIKTAIYALKGTLLVQLMDLLSKYQIHVPQQLGLVAFDDWGWAELTQPKITTIQQDPKMMGTVAAKALLDDFDHSDRKPKQLMVKSDLKIRQSLL